MIKQQSRDTINTKDDLIEQLVNKRYKNLRDTGQFETVNEIFSKLPISRIQKQQYVFLFDSVKQNVDAVIQRQNLIEKILEKQQENIKKIQIKSFKDKNKLLDREKEQDTNKKNVFSLSDHQFDNVEGVYNQKLSSSSARSINKSILFLRNQDKKLKEKLGEEEAFLPDQQYIDLRNITKEVGDIRLLLEDFPPLHRYQFEFMDENNIEFKSRNFPSQYEIDKRAQTLAKIYLLHLYRDEGRRAKQIYKNNDIEMTKQRQIRKIKQQLDVQKVKEGEMIEEMDLIKQVYKILVLIERKMNQLAYAEFTQKRCQNATIIKRSLQKLKRIVNEQPSAKTKLKILISYKHKKGW